MLRGDAFVAGAALVLALSLASPVEAIDGFALQKGPSGYWHLVMPSDVAATFRDSFPSYQIWPDSLYAGSVRKAFHYDEHTAPFAIIRDMNGDGFEDLVVDGRFENLRRGNRVDSFQSVMLAVSQGNRYRVMPTVGVGLPDGSPSRKPGHGLRVFPVNGETWHDSEPAPKWTFRWAWREDDFSRVFWWTDSTGFRDMTVCGVDEGRR